MKEEMDKLFSEISLIEETSQMMENLPNQSLDAVGGEVNAGDAEVNAGDAKVNAGDDEVNAGDGEVNAGFGKCQSRRNGSNIIHLGNLDLNL